MQIKEIVLETDMGLFKTILTEEEKEYLIEILSKKSLKLSPYSPLEYEELWP